jgi:hypothetical protein
MPNISNPAKFLVTKVISGSTTVLDNYAGVNSQYDGYPLSFTVELELDIQYHSNPATKTPMMYDAYDVKSNDWIAQPSGKTYKIREIVQVHDQNHLSVVLEDEDLYNLSFDNTQQGNNYPDEDQYGGIFELGFDGMPIITGLTVTSGSFSISSYWVQDVEGRFRYKNFLGSYLDLDQEILSWSSCVVGDFVFMGSNGKFIKIDNDNKDQDIFKAFGIITHIDSVDPSKISLRPFGKITSNLPTMPGVTGDLLYFDPNGTSSLSTDKPTTNAFPVYIKMTEDTALLLSNHPSSNIQIEVLPVDTLADLDQTTVGDTNGNYSPTGVTIEYTPFLDSMVHVKINGIEVNLGNGARTKDCYFSNDGGLTAKSIKNIAAGDELFWNGGIAGYELDPSDDIDFEYDAANLDIPSA